MEKNIQGDPFIINSFDMQETFFFLWGFKKSDNILGAAAQAAFLWSNVQNSTNTRLLRVMAKKKGTKFKDLLFFIGAAFGKFVANSL